MPMQLSCPRCGKMLTIRDELVGKRLKCPQCGEKFTADQAFAAAREHEAAARAPGAIHISPGMITLISIVVLGVGCGLFWKFGPGKVRAQWLQMEPDATNTVKDVVDFALEAESSRLAMLTGSFARGAPHSMEVNFLFTGMTCVRMPQYIGFVGSTTQGAMYGKYYPGNGEVAAEVDLGGSSLPGGGTVRRGNVQILVTGRRAGGAISAEIDGKTAEIHWPEPGKKRGL